MRGWRQGQPAQAALLGVFLALYDFIATSRLPLMDDLVTHLSGLPLAPLVAWSSEHTLRGFGLGDLLLASVNRHQTEQMACTCDWSKSHVQAI